MASYLGDTTLVPLQAATDAQTLERIFGIDARDLSAVFDWAGAPQDASLRKIIVRHAMAGGRWQRGAGSFRFIDRRRPVRHYAAGNGSTVRHRDQGRLA